MKNSEKSYLINNKKIKLIYAIGLLFFVVAFLIGILLGSTGITLLDIVDLFTKGIGSVGTRIIFYVRLPRTLAALFCGAALALSGAVIQSVLANKLASPSVIGVNSGAGLAVTLCTALGIYGGFRLSLFSFAGAFLAVMVVSLGAKKWGASRSTVILMGVALNSLLSAVSDAIVTFVPEVGVMSNDFKVGEFSAITYQKLIPAALLIAMSIVVLISLHNQLEVLSLGEDSAKGLGMNTGRMRFLFLLFAALLAGTAVSLAGLLSFVGLIVPHAVRRIAGNGAFHVMTLCALFGASFVCICDTAARVLFAPYEIPVGIIMAFLGAPFFLFILIKGRGGNRHDRA